MLSFIALAMLLGLGHILRTHIRLLQKLYLPSSVLGGLIGLAILQTARLTEFEIPAEWTAGWTSLPGQLISVVFASLFLGVRLPSPKVLWRRAGPQLAYGQTVAWGQYVVGVGLTLVLLTPVFGVPHMFGAIIPVGFEGGHGTAAGLRRTFGELGWGDGAHFAQASATAGIASAIIVGMVLINWAARRGHLARGMVDPEAVDLSGILPRDQRPSAGRLTVSSDAIESLTLHLVFIGVAILIGWLLQQGLIQIGAASGSPTLEKILKSFPLFPLAMVGGLLVQFWEQRYDRHHLIDKGLSRRIQGTALDFVVVPAIAMINLQALVPALAPFLILVAAAIAWNVFCVLVLARRMLPDVWFERSIAEMGQSMGITATGLVLLRVCDPDYETPAADAFAAKQLMHEPFMGGGLWTSAAIPLIAIHGGPLVFGIASAAVVGWIILTFATGMNRPDPSHAA